MDTLADILAALCLSAGLFFLLVGAIGIVRFPDAYNRMHASSKCSTLGLLGLLLGAVFHLGTLAVTTKALLTIVFAFVATPVGTHILARAAHMDGLRQWGKTLSDDLMVDRPERPPGCPVRKPEGDDDGGPPPFPGGDGKVDRVESADESSDGGKFYRVADESVA